MTVCENQAANLLAIIKAAKSGRLALLECQTTKSKKTVAVLVAVNKVEGDFEFVPLAQMFSGNPYKELCPPNPNEGFVRRRRPPSLKGSAKRPRKRKFMKKPIPKPVSTTDEVMSGRVRQALRRTWDAIAHDVLKLVAEEKGIGVEKAILKADEVIEAVTNAGFIGGYPGMYGDDKEALQWLESLSQEDRDTVVNSAFNKDTYYGL